ncbi:unnamed protein product [Lampetra planeri]
MATAAAARALPVVIIAAFLSSSTLVSCAPLPGANVTSNSSDPLLSALESLRAALGNGSLSALGVVQLLNKCGASDLVSPALLQVASNSSLDQWPATMSEVVAKVQKTFNVTSQDILSWVSKVLQLCSPSAAAGSTAAPGSQNPSVASPSAVSQKPKEKDQKEDEGSKEEKDDKKEPKKEESKKDDKSSKRDKPRKEQKAPSRNGN